MKAIYITKYNIYDIFWNDLGNLVILCPYTLEQPYNITIKDTLVSFKYFRCTSNHNYVYVNEAKNTSAAVDLVINGEILTVEPNRYPILTNRLIMSTMVKMEDNYIRQWINYHKALGVEHFVIYDNKDSPNTRYKSSEKKSDLVNLLKKSIDDGLVTLIDWPYPKYLPNSGNSGQTTQQNHSIWAFKTAKYIGLFDIDEYVNPQPVTYKNESGLNLKQMLDNYVQQRSNIGSLKIACKLFYNSNNQSNMGYDFLKIYNCEVKKGFLRGKHFVIPQNVQLFSIHKVVLGKKSFNLDPKLWYFNHYFFLNKPRRGQNQSKVLDASISTILTKINLPNLDD